jgi:hypothetical protein
MMVEEELDNVRQSAQGIREEIEMALQQMREGSTEVTPTKVLASLPKLIAEIAECVEMLARILEERERT